MAVTVTLMVVMAIIQADPITPAILENRITLTVQTDRPPNLYQNLE
ncbi:MAG: hypothetical protein L3J24_06485 [Xanthomonadales bacterium]|nr:hypothetical protein [Xanthomonadales bacterium]